MIRQLWLYGLLGMLTFPLSAQDPTFSQFYASPLQVNPAFAGVTYAPRITLNYRNQWPSWPKAYVTYAASYEQSIEAMNSGFGLILMTDKAGDGLYRRNFVSAVYGYQAKVKDEFFLKFGVEAGIIQSSVDWDRLVFGDQLDPIYGPSDPEGNPNISQEGRPEDLNNSLFNVSAGLLAYGRHFYGGLAIKHLNRPNENLLKINENLNAGLPMQLTLHGGAEITLDQGNNRQAPSFISPNILFIKQAGFGQVNAGAYAGFGKFFGGLWYRHAFNNPDAAIVLAGVRHGVLRIGYSFDVTISGLTLARTGGTHELSVMINFEDSEALRRKRHRSRYNNCFKMFN